ncbi:MAG: T9SS type A sorting domain-containing protein [Bacteroidota bacterium]
MKTNNVDEYRIRLYFYRDCVGVFVPTTLKVAVRNSSMPTPDTIPLSMISVSITGAANNCVSGISGNCSGGFGIEEYIYEGLVVLMPSNDWIVSFTECCRNAALSCTTNPNSDYMYVEATLDNLNFPNNSTPEFNSSPSLAECLFAPALHNNSVTEIDGDSIVYELIQARTNHFDTLSYNAAPGIYCGFNFFRVSPTVALNIFNGVVTFTPEYIQMAVMVVKAIEFRNGVESGSVMRDIMLRFINGQVGIKDYKNESTNIYPVPASNRLNLRIPGITEPFEIRIYNSTGELEKGFINSLDLDISNLNPGIYSLQSISNKKITTSKFVK